MRARRLQLALTFAAAGAVLLPAYAAAEPALEPVAEFRAPAHVAQAPGRPNLVFVVEQRGRVMLARNGVKLKRPFLDLRDRVRFGTSDEAGLWSIAFDPGYRQNRRFYVYYSANSGANRVESFTADPDDGTVALESTRTPVIVIRHPYSDLHNGGQLAFGEDGYLWLSTGDGTCCGDPFDQARSLGTLLGKLLRIDPVETGGYTVPADNPLVGEAGLDEIYAWGFRNLWRFNFDRRADGIVLGDVGQSAHEEIDYLLVTSAAGANFGWPEYEGFAPYDPERPGPGPRVFPRFTYPHAPACAVTSGPVVRGSALPSLRRRLLYADLCTGQIRSLATTGPADDRHTGLRVPLPTSFGTGHRGAVYVASLEGEVSQIVER
jgi:glucose/arabinose dehydrogenase